MTDYEIKVREFENEWSSSDRYVTAHTSGSTGKPKEIRLLKSDMLRSAQATNAFFGIDRDSLLVCPLSVDYIAGKMMMVRASAAGCNVVMEEPSMTPLSSVPDSAEISLVAIVPAQIPGLLQRGSLSRIRSVIIGGSPLTAEQEKIVARSGVMAWSTYGMTETCSHVALRRAGVSGCYEGLPGYIFSTDARGCLVVENESMSFRRLVTNDIVELRDSRHFVVKGRFDNVIISGGEKIFPEEMENRVRKEFSEREFYFTSRSSERWGSEVVMLVEGDEDAETRSRLMEICATLLPRHHVPKAIVFQHRFERTSSGKLIRKR